MKVTLKLGAKAVSQEVARQELDFQKYILDKKKEVISIANYYEIPSKSKLSSILLAEYEIHVPIYSRMTVSNSYGNIEISGKQGHHKVTNRFGNITLEDVGGSGEFESYFGDFTAQNLAGRNELKFNKTKTVIDGLSGMMIIESKLGDVTIDQPDALLGLNIEASKSDIIIGSLKNWGNFEFNLKSEFGEVIIPQTMPSLPNQSGNVSSWRYRGGASSLIKVSTSFGVISLTTE